MNPLTLNGYSYANNNPVMKVNPDGELAWWIGKQLQEDFKCFAYAF
ncbi:hypothetical protein ABIA69_000974 [Lysinibacillus parviboronicapiens]|uniref:RHS repeat-associated core domain-containing protein n=1 Tax=Lysinibacillus parviboronicapiens TaxID=436516 RepID=A0ABV2PFU8_9BACI